MKTLMLLLVVVGGSQLAHSNEGVLTAPVLKFNESGGFTWLADKDVVARALLQEIGQRDAKIAEAGQRIQALELEKTELKKKIEAASVDTSKLKSAKKSEAAK